MKEKLFLTVDSVNGFFTIYISVKCNGTIGVNLFLVMLLKKKHRHQLKL